MMSKYIYKYILKYTINNMDNDQINKLIDKLSMQKEYVKNIIADCEINMKKKNNYNFFEKIFIKEINRKYDEIIYILLNYIDKNIMAKIIQYNEEKIINYILKFKNLTTIELFLEIMTNYCAIDYLNLLMINKFNYKPMYNNEFVQMSFLNIILSHSLEYGAKKKIDQKYLIPIIKKLNSLEHYLEIEEFAHHYSNFMTVVVSNFDLENIIEIINWLINLTENENIYDLLKIKIYHSKSYCKTRLNLFEYFVIELNGDYSYDKSLKLLEFVISRLGTDNYINFVLTECELDLVIANSSKCEYWNRENVKFNLVWRDEFITHIEPTKLVYVSYWKTSILFEALCNKNTKFVKKLLTAEADIVEKIDFDIVYTHCPEYSREYTFMSLLLFYYDYENIKKEIRYYLYEIINICIKELNSKINFDSSDCLKFIVKNCFNEFYESNKKLIHDNLDSFNWKLIEFDKFEEFKKIIQTKESVVLLFDYKFRTLCENNNVKFVEYVVDKFFEFNTIEDIKSNYILESFEYVCEKNYIELIDLLFEKFIKSDLDHLVNLKYDNFADMNDTEKIKKTKSTKTIKTKLIKKTKSKKINNFYFDKIVDYCGENKNYQIVEKLFNSKYKFDYFSFIDKVCDETFLFKIIKYEFTNEFITQVIDTMGEKCFPQYQNKKTTDTALTLASKKNLIPVFNKLIEKFGNKVHPILE